MNKNIIDDNEILYRAIRKSCPNALINGKPSAALFIDENGVSVDRDGGRDEKSIIDSFKERFDKKMNDYDCSVRIRVKDCRRVGTYVNPIGNKKNVFHAEIHESREVVKISLLKAILLAQECQIV